MRHLLLRLASPGVLPSVASGAVVLGGNVDEGMSLQAVFFWGKGSAGVASSSFWGQWFRLPLSAVGRGAPNRPGGPGARLSLRKERLRQKAARPSPRLSRGPLAYALSFLPLASSIPQGQAPTPELPFGSALAGAHQTVLCTE
jgi:hypothetical protein